MELILLGITGALSVSLIPLLLAAGIKNNGLQSKVEALTAERDELRKQSAQDREDFKHTINQVRAYHEQHVERQKKEISKGNVVHDDEWEKALNAWLESVDEKWKESPWFLTRLEKANDRLNDEPKQLDKK